MIPEAFPQAVLTWFDRHGRHDLPWQRHPTAYRVWVSEIMLQQTRVTTVIPYYLRFVQRFPDVRALADAPLDEVLHLWSGLGYYARARNLHKAAQVVRDEHAGRFPQDIATLLSLPGIGRSTAGAVLALSAGQRHAILDGNVKRVLARFHAVDGWPGATATLKELWTLAERHTPQERLADYTQAMMDLGATVCLRSRPLCAHCPLAAGCEAVQRDAVDRYPAPRPRRALPVRGVRMLLITDGTGEVLLERRPPVGIWGGLWGFPECSAEQAPEAWCQEHLGLAAQLQDTWKPIRHTFSHFHLDITPVCLELRDRSSAVGVMEGGRRLWYNPNHPLTLGLAAPVGRLLTAFVDWTGGSLHGGNGELCKTG